MPSSNSRLIEKAWGRIHQGQLLNMSSLVAAAEFLGDIPHTA